MSLRHQWLPFAPLLAYKPMAMSEWGRWGQGINTHGSRFARMWHRGQASGFITVSAADELCVHLLRMHPSEVFGDLWFGFEDTA